MNPLEKFIRARLLEGMDEGELYSFLKSMGHTDDEIRSNWTLPSEVSWGEGLGAAGRGVGKAVEGTAHEFGQILTGNKNPLDLITGIPASLADIGKGMYGVAKAATHPNMPADERLANLEQGGSTAASLGIMDVIGRSLNEAFPRKGSTAGLSVLSPRAMAAEAAKIPDRPPVTPQAGVGLPKMNLDLIDQIIDPNVGQMGKMPTPAKGMGNAPGPQIKPSMTIPPDPNIPMGTQVPESFMGLSKPGNAPPVRTGQSPLPGVIKGAEGEMQYLERAQKPLPSPSELVDQLPYEMQTSRGGPGRVAPKYTLSPSEMVDRLPPDMQTSRGTFKGTGPTPKTDALRASRNEQIMSDPEFRAKFMQHPERGALNISPWMAFYYGPKVMKMLGKAAKSSVTSDFMRPSVFGMPFAVNMEDK